MSGSDPAAVMPHQGVIRLAVLAAEAAGQHPDPATLFRASIKTAIISTADPYLVIGLTIEGIATAVAERMPPECQPGVMQATVSLLLDRFAA